MDNFNKEELLKLLKAEGWRDQISFCDSEWHWEFPFMEGTRWLRYGVWVQGEYGPDKVLIYDVDDCDIGCCGGLMTEVGIGEKSTQEVFDKVIEACRKDLKESEEVYKVEIKLAKQDDDL